MGGEGELKLGRPGKGKLGGLGAEAKRLRLESMAFMAAKAGFIPGKRLPNANGLGKFRGNISGRPFVNMSKVNPG